MENVYNRYEGDRQVKHRVTKKHLGPNKKLKYHRYDKTN